MCCSHCCWEYVAIKAPLPRAFLEKGGSPSLPQQGGEKPSILKTSSQIFHLRVHILTQVLETCPERPQSMRAASGLGKIPLHNSSIFPDSLHDVCLLINLIASQSTLRNQCWFVLKTLKAITLPPEPSPQPQSTLIHFFCNVLKWKLALKRDFFFFFLASCSIPLMKF